MSIMDASSIIITSPSNGSPSPLPKNEFSSSLFVSAFFVSFKNKSATVPSSDDSKYSVLYGIVST